MYCSCFSETVTRKCVQTEWKSNAHQTWHKTYWPHLQELPQEGPLRWYHSQRADSIQIDCCCPEHSLLFSVHIPFVSVECEALILLDVLWVMTVAVLPFLVAHRDTLNRWAQYRHRN